MNLLISVYCNLLKLDMSKGVQKELTQGTLLLYKLQLYSYQ